MNAFLAKGWSGVQPGRRQRCLKFTALTVVRTPLADLLNMQVVSDTWSMMVRPCYCSKGELPHTAAKLRSHCPLRCDARSLQGNTASSSSSSSGEQAVSFLAFAAADLAPAVAAACQHAEHVVRDDPADVDEHDGDGFQLQYSGDRIIPLASWVGTPLGPMPM